MDWVFLEFAALEGRDGVKNHAAPALYADIISEDLCGRRTGTTESRRTVIEPGGEVHMDMGGMCMIGRPTEKVPCDEIVLGFASEDVVAIADQLRHNPLRTLTTDSGKPLLYRKLYSKWKCMLIPDEVWTAVSAVVLPQVREMRRRGDDFRRMKIRQMDDERATLVGED